MDLAGQEKYEDTQDPLYEGSGGAIFFFDITSIETYKNLFEDWPDNADPTKTHRAWIKRFWENHEVWVKKVMEKIPKSVPDNEKRELEYLLDLVPDILVANKFDVPYQNVKDGIATWEDYNTFFNEIKTQAKRYKMDAAFLSWAKGNLSFQIYPDSGEADLDIKKIFEQNPFSTSIADIFNTLIAAAIPRYIKILDKIEQMKAKYVQPVQNV